MEPESLITYSQQPTFIPHPAPDESNSTPLITFHSTSASLDREGAQLIAIQNQSVLTTLKHRVDGTRVAK